MAQEELQESKLTKAGGRKPTHGCNYPMVGWPSVILTPMGPSLNLTREGTSRPSLRSSLSLSLEEVTMYYDQMYTTQVPAVQRVRYQVLNLSGDNSGRLSRKTCVLLPPLHVRQ